jgi:hypothetical protein
MITMGEKQQKFALMLAEFIIWLNKNNYTVRIGEVWRPIEMQELYLKTGKTRAKYSKHQDKVAADLAIFKNGIWLKSKEELNNIGKYWENMDVDNRWGGNFQSLTDCPHFEYNG